MYTQNILRGHRHYTFASSTARDFDGVKAVDQVMDSIKAHGVLKPSLMVASTDTMRDNSKLSEYFGSIPLITKIGIPSSDSSSWRERRDNGFLNPITSVVSSDPSDQPSNLTVNAAELGDDIKVIPFYSTNSSLPCGVSPEDWRAIVSGPRPSIVVINTLDFTHSLHEFITRMVRTLDANFTVSATMGPQSSLFVSDHIITDGAAGFILQSKKGQELSIMDVATMSKNLLGDMEISSCDPKLFSELFGISTKPEDLEKATKIVQDDNAFGTYLDSPEVPVNIMEVPDVVLPFAKRMLTINNPQDWSLLRSYFVENIPFGIVNGGEDVGTLVRVRGLYLPQHVGGPCTAVLQAIDRFQVSDKRLIPGSFGMRGCLATSIRDHAMESEGDKKKAGEVIAACKDIIAAIINTRTPEHYETILGECPEDPSSASFWLSRMVYHDNTHLPLGLEWLKGRDTLTRLESVLQALQEKRDHLVSLPDCIMPHSLKVDDSLLRAVIATPPEEGEVEGVQEILDATRALFEVEVDSSDDEREG
jgi:hypothetical protein